MNHRQYRKAATAADLFRIKRKTYRIHKVRYIMANFFKEFRKKRKYKKLLAQKEKLEASGTGAADAPRPERA